MQETNILNIGTWWLQISWRLGCDLKETHDAYDVRKPTKVTHTDVQSYPLAANDIYNEYRWWTSKLISDRVVASCSPSCWSTFSTSAALTLTYYNATVATLHATITPEQRVTAYLLPRSRSCMEIWLLVDNIFLSKVTIRFVMRLSRMTEVVVMVMRCTNYPLESIRCQKILLYITASESVWRSRNYFHRNARGTDVKWRLIMKSLLCIYCISIEQ